MNLVTSRAAALLFCLVAVGFICCSKPMEPPESGAAFKPELKSISPPDLSQAEPNVREQLEEQHELVQALLIADPGPVQLAESFGSLGLLYVAYTFNDAAENCFLNAQTLAPQDYRWPYLVGYLLQIQGQLESGSQFLERALTLQPGYQPSLLRLGNLRLEQGDYKEAQRYFDQVLVLDSKSAAALNGLGKARAGLNDEAGAVAHFERALALQPTASSIDHALGLAYRNLGRRDLAQDHLAKGGDAPVLFSDPLLQETASLGRSAEIYLVRGAQAFSEERFEAAAGFYQEALRLDPLNFTTYKAYGFSLEKIGDLTGAIDQLKLALQKGTSGDESRDRLERAELYRILGGLTVLRGRQEEAIGYFQQALKLNEDNLDARAKLANALARQGNFDEAIRHYDWILKSLPDHAKTLVRRATAKINLGQGSEALKDFARAVEVEPENAQVRNSYAAALEHLGQSSAARAQLQAVENLTEDDPERASLIAVEATNQLRRGEIDSAIQSLRQALSLDPTNSNARYQLATAYGHQGRLDEALRELRIVIDAAPLHGPARRAEVTALLLQQRYGEARVRLNEGLRAMPRERSLAIAFVRVLATAPDARVRNGQLALEIANRLYSDAPDSVAIETLALAMAEAGNIARAVTLLQDLLSSPAPSVSGSSAQQIRREIEAFQQSTPWRVTSPDEIIQAAFASG